MLFYMVVPNTPADQLRQPKIEESLFNRIGQDDATALEELYIKTTRVIHTYVLSMVKDPDDTADIVQEVYLKIRASAHLYQPLGKPLAWMFTIARNLSLTHLRVHNRSPRDDLNSIEDDLHYSYVTDETDRMILHAALRILKEEERQVLLLHVVSGLKHREIAGNMSLPLSTVLSRYHRSLKKLKSYLVEQGVSR